MPVAEVAAEPVLLASEEEPLPVPALFEDEAFVCVAIDIGVDAGGLDAEVLPLEEVTAEPEVIGLEEDEPLPVAALVLALLMAEDFVCVAEDIGVEAIEPDVEDLPLEELTAEPVELGLEAEALVEPAPVLELLIEDDFVCVAVDIILDAGVLDIGGLLPIGEEAEPVALG